MRTNSTGFSLVELMVILAVLAIFVSSVQSRYKVFTHKAKQSGAIVIAKNLHHQTLEFDLPAKLFPDGINQSNKEERDYFTRLNVIDSRCEDESSPIANMLQFDKSLCKSGFDYYFLRTNKNERWALIAESNFLHYCGGTDRSRNKFSREQIVFTDNGCSCMWIDSIKSTCEEFKAFSVKFDFDACCNQQTVSSGG